MRMYTYLYLRIRMYNMYIYTDMLPSSRMDRTTT